MPQVSDSTGTAFSPGQTIYYTYGLDHSTLYHIGGWYAFRKTSLLYRALRCVGYTLPLDSDGDGLIEHGSDGVPIGMDCYDYAY